MKHDRKQINHPRLIRVHPRLESFFDQMAPLCRPTASSDLPQLGPPQRGRLQKPLGRAGHSFLKELKK
jgi:hypothetical protein